MSRKIIIFTIATILYLICILYASYLVNYYIGQKTSRLWEQFMLPVNKLFSTQSNFADTEYFNRGLVYNHTTVVEYSPLFRYFVDDLRKWNDKHSDIVNYYKIDSTQNRWKINVCEKIWDQIYLYDIFPVCVGYKAADYEINYFNYPSVKECVDDAYDFYTKDPNSYTGKIYEKGIYDKIYNMFLLSNNEYFYWEVEFQSSKLHNVNRFIDIGNFGYMSNEYCKVFIGSGFYRAYNIKKNDDFIEKEKTDLIFKLRIIVSIIYFIVVLIILGIWIFNRNLLARNERIRISKIQEPLHDKLKRLCNPKNFMDPYNNEKITLSNLIYEEVMRTNPSDYDKLKHLRSKAMKELNVSFISDEYLEYLKKLCDPQNYISPFNSEKLAIANNLYNELINNRNDIEKLEEIEERAKMELLR